MMFPSLNFDDIGYLVLILEEYENIIVNVWSGGVDQMMRNGIYFYE